MNKKHIDLEIQGGIIRRFTDLVLDYTGTLSLDGVFLPGVVERLLVSWPACASRS